MGTEFNRSVAQSQYRMGGSGAQREYRRKYPTDKTKSNE